MRKRILLFLLSVVLCLGLIYFILPNKIAINERGDLNVNAKAFPRVFFDQTNWRQWWPGEKERAQDAYEAFLYKDNKYTVVARRFTSLVIAISHEGDSASTELFLIPVRPNRVQLAWVGTSTVGSNPIARIKNYQWAKSLSSDMHFILQRLESFYTNDDRLYGYPIRETIVVDSLLVSTSMVTKSRPSTEVIYTLVDKLKAFIQSKEAKETSAPMLNISASGDSMYLTRVAIPVNKPLKTEGDIQFKKMLSKGNILTGEIKGGPWQVEKAFAQMENFVSDNNRTAPAIPFQKLVTDRITEPDTTKWVTKIYWPVM